MGFLSRTGDTFYALRFLKIMTTPWEKMDAFKFGILDKNGKRLRSAETPEERSAFTPFHKLIFNLKRILEKIPAGKSAVGTYIAALMLLRESNYLNDAEVKLIIAEDTTTAAVAGHAKAFIVSPSKFKSIKKWDELGEDISSNDIDTVILQCRQTGRLKVIDRNQPLSLTNNSCCYPTN